jgi:hypothetical protein
MISSSLQFPNYFKATKFMKEGPIVGQGWFEVHIKIRILFKKIDFILFLCSFMAEPSFNSFSVADSIPSPLIRRIIN